MATVLAEALSEFSKAAYRAFSEVEDQSRLEIARAMAKVREAKIERDKANKDLHACQLEAQSWKQEVSTTKATLIQAELTIAHQAETLAEHAESIAQLRREVTQWKDQSKNWQDHFLRVEQERCAQSSKLDELLVGKLHYTVTRPDPANLFSPPKSNNYLNDTTSALSFAPNPQQFSPTQPPAYKSAAPSSPQNGTSSISVQVAQIPPQKSRKRRNTVTSKGAGRREQEPEPKQDVAPYSNEQPSEAGPSKPRKGNTNTVSAAKRPEPLAPPSVPTLRSSTVVRRVQAVINVKRESSYDDETLEGIPQISTSISTGKKKKSESVDQRQYLRTPRRRIMPYDSEDEEEAASQLIYSSPVTEDDLQQGREKRRLRQRNRVNYEESDHEGKEDEDDEEDELMMGSGDNLEEYETQRKDISQRQTRKTVHSAKRRKVVGR